ncbi:hypothetical protein BDR05DRAFT_992793 [Suillus weaverae]|nr:hypothetical protein BDR05DRAFT_992793 [Suillus weaverae]
MSVEMWNKCITTYDHVKHEGSQKKCVGYKTSTSSGYIVTNTITGTWIQQDKLPRTFDSNGLETESRRAMRGSTDKLRQGHHRVLDMATGYDEPACLHQVGLSSTFGLAGQGAQCRTRTDERTNAPMNHARRIRVNGPRMQRQSGLTLWKNMVWFGNRAMTHANARCTDKPRLTYQGARSSYAKTKPLEPGHQNAFKLSAMPHANARCTDKPHLTHQGERFSYARQSHLTLMIMQPRSWIYLYQMVFKPASQGGNAARAQMHRETTSDVSSRRSSGTKTKPLDPI